MKYSVLTILAFLIAATKSREFRDYDSEYDDYDDVSEKPHYDLKDAPALFEKFIKDFEKKYSNEEDKKIHYEIFKKNIEEINRLNAGKEGEAATFDINLFTDMKTKQDEDVGWGDEQPELSAEVIKYDLVKIAGTRWMQAATDRSNWKSMGEAYVQQWTSYGRYDDDDEEAKDRKGRTRGSGHNKRERHK